MDDLKHYEKEINQKYSINEELWTKRLYEVEKQDFPNYNDRIFYLCQDAKWSYMYELPKGTIMYLSLATEQILKNILLKINNHSKEIYEIIEGNEKIEGKKNIRGKTFGFLISEIKKTNFNQNKDIIEIFENINKIRNKSSAHLKNPWYFIDPNYMLPNYDEEDLKSLSKIIIINTEKFWQYVAKPKQYVQIKCTKKELPKVKNGLNKYIK